MKLRHRYLHALMAIWLSVLTPAFGEIQVGDRQDDVYRIMGYPDSSTRIGQMETISYKDGTKITLRNGVVEEITVRGLMRIGNKTQIVPDARAGNAATAKVQTQPASGSAASKAPTSAIDTTNLLPAQTTVKISESKRPPAVSMAAVSLNTKKAVVAKAEPQAVVPNLGSAGSNIDRIKKAVVGLLMVFLILSVAAYLFTCFCYKRICEKTGVEPGVLVWIPVAQFIPLLQVAKLPSWVLIMLLVPLVNIVAMFMLWAKICAARGKSPWLAATLAIPVAGFVLIAYLAFSGGDQLTSDTELATTPPESPATDSAEKTDPEPTSEIPDGVPAGQTVSV